jgi:sensor histidine kinase regulating citrate/malate metabolism
MIINNSKVTFESNIAILSKQISTQISYYETLKDYENDLRRFRHDYENVLICLKMLLQTDDKQQALRFIDDMTDCFDFSKLSFNSGNYIADALMNEKSHKASKYNTKLDFEGLIPSSRISNYELCIILSNALDNAIEACAEIDGEKTIEIVSQIKSNIWYFSVRNPVKHKVKIYNNSILTTKNDTNLHGFGLYSIEQTIKKGGGRLQLTCSNTTFTLDTFMKLDAVQLLGR